MRSRALIRSVAVASLGAVLAACGSPPTPASSASPSAASARTDTATATATAGTATTASGPGATSAGPGDADISRYATLPAFGAGWRLASSTTPDPGAVAGTWEFTAPGRTAPTCSVTVEAVSGDAATIEAHAAHQRSSAPPGARTTTQPAPPGQAGPVVHVQAADTTRDGDPYSLDLRFERPARTMLLVVGASALDTDADRCHAVQLAQSVRWTRAVMPVPAAS